MGDYEEEFGSFIPDQDNADYHARKDAAFNALIAQRGEVGKYFTLTALVHDLTYTRCSVFLP